MGGLLEGVQAYIAQIRGELRQAMVLTGCATVAAVDHAILFEKQEPLP
jgi:isopentenyl diphosphate isomerase/L-lactate dehydrogenase-like FMN-dependent dehydrogenase